MDEVIIGVLVTGALLFAPLLGVVWGATCGWVVGGVFPRTTETFIAMFFEGKVEPWQVGAMLGFVGSFFRAYVPKKQD